MWRCQVVAICQWIPFSIYADQPPPKNLSHVRNIYGELDYLFWVANPNGLFCPTVATGSSPVLDPSWGSGLRACLGTRPSSWDTKLGYSYYSTSSHDASHADIETILSGTPSTSGIFEVGEEWKLNFNRIDWEFGRKIAFHDHFAMRPFFGIEGLDIGQKFDLDTNTAFLDVNEDLPATNVVTSNNKNLFLAIGARAGFDAFFKVGKGIEFFGNFSGSVLWGRFRIKQHYNETDFFSTGASSVLVSQTKQLSQSDSIFNCDLGLGFNWKHYFLKPRLGLLLKLGWEQHFYTDLVRFQNFYLQQTSSGTAAYFSDGNLSLSGLTFGILLDY